MFQKFLVLSSKAVLITFLISGKIRGLHDAWREQRTLELANTCRICVSSSGWNLLHRADSGGMRSLWRVCM